VSIPEPTGARAVDIGANRDSSVRLSAALVMANAAIARLVNDSGPDAKGYSVFQRGGCSAPAAR
jgi:hypothetical protein